MDQPTETSQPEAYRPLFEFGELAGQSGPLADWFVINDGVMGGRSASSIEATSAGTALFAGTVSLENNGGFASVRTRPGPWDLGGYTGIALRVRGDGQTYMLQLRTDDYFDGASYRSAFTFPVDGWQTVRLAFAAMRPTFRDRILPNVPPLDPSQIRTFGFMISDKQAGPFRLEVAWIRAFR